MSKKKQPFPTAAKILIGVVLAAFAIKPLLILLAVLGVFGETGPSSSEWEGREAPELVVVTIQGDELRLSELKGRRVVVDFWATWCPPCVKETPHFERIAREFSDDELIVIGVSDEDDRTIRSFADTHRLSYPLGRATEMGPPFDGIRSIPTTFFINREGIIERVVRGYKSYEELRELAAGSSDVL